MFATGPGAVGFTIVWTEGVIFSSMMTYYVQFLLLVVAGWVNRQQQDVIDYLQEVYVAFVIDRTPFSARRQLRPRRHLACRDTQDGRGALARSRGAVLQRK